MIRDEVRQFLKDQRESFVEEVFGAAGHLNMAPLQRTVVGCLKALGDRFAKVTKDELLVAVLVVQIQCAHSKRKSKSSGIG
jgi:hypothetical protein